MRSLITSIICLIILIGGWLIFYNYSDNYLHQSIKRIDDEIMVEIEEENWSDAYEDFSNINSNWHKYKKVASFFLDTETINEIDFTFSKTIKYIKAKDVSNGSGELNCLKEQLIFLHKNETLNLENIF
ncbi:MAG: DUF4363 family protein [Eubacteriales bacterium]|nr:DUF4363 family protein [Eubacteriales bacterium]